MSKHFSSPPRLVMGTDALDTVAAELPERGSGILIVTDPGIVAAGILDLVIGALEISKLPIHTFTEVVGNPDVATVEAASRALESSGADLVVAVGGGSSMDVAKSIALLATNGGAIADYEGG